jgi:hypothetical protein
MFMARHSRRARGRQTQLMAGLKPGRSHHLAIVEANDTLATFGQAQIMCHQNQRRAAGD